MMSDKQTIYTLKRKFLCDEALDRLDPCRVGRKWFTTHYPQEANVEPLPSLFQGRTDTIINTYVTSITVDGWESGKHAPVISYEIEMSHKCGRQGGHLTWADAHSTFDAYYHLPLKVTFGEVAEAGLETFLDMIREAIAKFGLPAISPLSYGHTAAALPYGGYKDDEFLYYLMPFSGWLHPLPLLPNSRYQRLKPRSIFAASYQDQAYVQPSLTAVREWLKKAFPHIFGAWINPKIVLWPDMRDAVRHNHWFLETDFKAMDQHYTRAVVLKLILPIYQLLLPPADYLHFAAYVEESFEAPLLCGHELWTGEHTLFSGLPYTNDFETLYDVIIYLGAHVLAGQPASTFGRHFKACGDDVVYHHRDKKVVITVRDYVTAEFTRNGVVLSEEKTRFQQGEARFCRCVYYPALPDRFNGERYYMRPAYPCVLMLNNCVQPENIADSRTHELLHSFERGDVAMGNPFYVNALTILYSNVARPDRPVDLSDENSRYFEEHQTHDWWFKVYGITYSLKSSPTAQWYHWWLDQNPSSLQAFRSACEAN